MTYVQLTERRGKTRGPASEFKPPNDGLIELKNVEEDQRVVQVKWHRGYEARARKTVDWYWTATLESRFEPVA